MSDNHMTVGERITIRISEEQLRLVQDMIDSGRAESISDVIRAALEEYLAKFYSPENIRKLTVDLPKGSVSALVSAPLLFVSRPQESAPRPGEKGHRQWLTRV